MYDTVDEARAGFLLQFCKVAIANMQIYTADIHVVSNPRDIMTDCSSKISATVQDGEPQLDRLNKVHVCFYLIK